MVHTGAVMVRDAWVRYRVHGAGTTTLVLVHGMSANHAWWRLVTPLLRERYRVAEVDLTGHGDSDHRDAYVAEAWTDEVVAVADAVRGPVVLVGHSMGGALALMAAQHDQVIGLVALDTRLKSEPLTPDGAEQVRRTHTSSGRQRVYPTYEEARSRFVLGPPQPQPPESVLHPVARASIREVEGGWTWKADQTRPPRFPDRFGERALEELRRPTLLIRGEFSRVVEADDLQGYGESVSPAHRARVTLAEVSGAHHHLPLEAPAACARMIDDFAAGLTPVAPMARSHT